MLRCVALVKTDVSEELSASFITVTRIGELGTMLAVTSNRRTLRVTLMKEARSSSETSVLTRATQRNMPEDAILRNWSSFTVSVLKAFQTQAKTETSSELHIFAPVFLCRKYKIRGMQCNIQLYNVVSFVTIWLYFVILFIDF
jgi:hypothetical protein